MNTLLIVILITFGIMVCFGLYNASSKKNLGYILPENKMDSDLKIGEPKKDEPKFHRIRKNNSMYSIFSESYEEEEKIYHTPLNADNATYSEHNGEILTRLSKSVLSYTKSSSEWLDGNNNVCSSEISEELETIKKYCIEHGNPWPKAENYEKLITNETVNTMKSYDEFARSPESDDDDEDF